MDTTPLITANVLAYDTSDVTQPVVPGESLHTTAVRTLVEMHGSVIQYNPNFNAMIQDIVNQITNSIMVTKGQ